MLFSTYRGGVLDPVALDDKCQTSTEPDPECYEEYQFKKHGLRVLDEHDPSVPLFYFHAFHFMHSPLDVPLAYLDKVDKMIAPATFDDADRFGFFGLWWGGTCC